MSAVLLTIDCKPFFSASNSAIRCWDRRSWLLSRTFSSRDSGEVALMGLLMSMDPFLGDFVDHLAEPEAVLAPLSLKLRPCRTALDTFRRTPDSGCWVS